MHGLSTSLYMMMISDKVTFLCNDVSFIMKCNGDFADLMIDIARGNTSSKSKERSLTKSCNGTFSLKYINLFIKSSALCSNVEIYLKRGYPLILVYRIGSLGKVQFVLAPLEQDGEQDQEEEEDNEEEEDIEELEEEDNNDDEEEDDDNDDDNGSTA